MRWSDERYVRVYVRDTATWLLWSWETRALFLFIMRKVDRAGLLHVGRTRPERGLAAVVGMPVDVVARSLPALMDAGEDDSPTVRISNEGVLVVPNFIEAQDARTDAAERQREHRARARDRAVSHNVAISADPVSHDVTDSHTASHDVTPYLSVPIRAVPKEQIPVPDGTLPLLVVESSPAFDLLAIYRDYPKHEGKTKGLAKLQKQIRTPGDYEALKRALEAYRTSKTVADGFVKNFDTWAGCWRDYLEAPHDPPQRAYNGRG